MSLDAFPAKAMMPAGNTLAPVRAVIADGQLQIWVLTAAGPEKTFERPVASTEGSFNNGLVVHSYDGMTVIGRDVGCGCGNALAHADLFEGRRRINVSL